MLDAQKRLAPPADINRLIVIHPEGAAGWADVAIELGRYQSAGIAETIDISVAFEGKNAIPSLLGALHDVVEIHKSKPIDLVMLVRGGGASSGFANLANAVLARAICELGIPVLTGIGHACDRSIIDEVSWRSADTPSKALAFVASLIRESAVRARNDMTEILRLSRRAIAGREGALSETIAVAQSIARRRFFDAGGRLEGAYANLRIEIAIVQTDLRHASLALDRLRSDLFADVPESLFAQVSDLQGDAYATRTQPVALPGSDERPNQSGGVAIDLIDEQLSAVLDLGAALAAHAVRLFGADYAALVEYECCMRALSIQDTLERGFALAISPAAGAIVTTAEAARALDHFEILFNDGCVAVRLAVVAHITAKEGS
jgi:exodeoxyribonuclease VII large subunit